MCTNEICSETKSESNHSPILTLIPVCDHGINLVQTSIKALEFDLLCFARFYQMAVRITPFACGDLSVAIRVRENIE